MTEQLIQNACESTPRIPTLALAGHLQMDIWRCLASTNSSLDGSLFINADYDNLATQTLRFNDTERMQFLMLLWASYYWGYDNSTAVRLSGG